MQELNISLLQWDIIWENPAKNLEKAGKLMKKLIRPQLVVLPEMFTTGFSMKAESLAEGMDGPSVKWMLENAANTNAVLAGSLIIRENNYNFNRMIVAFPNGNIQHYDKRHLFTYAGEDKFFTAGSKPMIFEIDDWKIKLLICYDLRFPVWSRNTDYTDLMLYVANWPESRSYAWNHLLKARAIENLCYVAGVNRIGADGNNINYIGDSQLVDFSGKVLGSLEDKEGILSVQLCQSDLIAFRKRFPFLKDRDDFCIKI